MARNLFDGEEKCTILGVFIDKSENEREKEKSMR